MTGIEIVIDELVVRGLSPQDARRAATAFERRLAALAGPLEPRGRAESFRQLPPVTADAAGVGAAVAAAVWSSLSGGSAR